MLILTRKVDEAILIEGGIVITVLNIDYARGRVSLGIEAPGLKIQREELAIKARPNGEAA